jgi:hypothetical protein
MAALDLFCKKTKSREGAKDAKIPARRDKEEKAFTWRLEGALST